MTGHVGELRTEVLAAARWAAGFALVYTRELHDHFRFITEPFWLKGQEGVLCEEFCVHFTWPWSQVELFEKSCHFAMAWLRGRSG